MKTLIKLDYLQKYLTENNYNAFQTHCLNLKNKIMCIINNFDLKSYKIILSDPYRQIIENSLLINSVDYLIADCSHNTDELFAIQINSFHSFLKLNLCKISLIDGRKIVLVEIPIYSLNYSKYSYKADFEYSVTAKFLNNYYILIKFVVCLLEKTLNYFIIADIKNSSYYFFPDELSNKLLDLSQVNLLNSKYLFIELRNESSDKKHDFFFKNKINLDIADIRFYTEKQIIYPFEQFLKDIPKGTIDIKKYTLAIAKEEYTFIAHYIKDNYFYCLKTYINENKTELIKTDLESMKSQIISTVAEKILPNSSFLNYKIIKADRTDDKDCFYIVKLLRSSHINTVIVIYLGEKTFEKTYTLNYGKEEMLIDFCEKDNYFLTGKISKNSSGLIDYRFYTISNSKLLLEISQCNNFLILKDFSDKNTIYVIPY
ncbi:hypothetical protein [Caldicellulosiruptor acetigenus]|uniref:Uncharacterized protein n=1 Tax=Caldicellulosiruptor acetigenus 6A TaxID=632516 RepID=G2PUJ5_9FIRM|nr:hypothetical protein [Caldicellulosiruptor acetigenus]AEM74468.1 hypothetical protein Calla_1890 [Caldicellulosiruptor acetigenus 6A]